MEKVLTRYIGTPNLWKLETYRSLGGYQTLEKALREYQPDDIVTMVRDSGLRGRGGAGFPTGVKWGFLPKDDRPRYLVCNGDESEPGTFKDRVLIEDDPHQVLEGLIISCYAVHASLAFLYLRGEFFLGAQRLQAAIDEAYTAGYSAKISWVRICNSMSSCTVGPAPISVAKRQGSSSRWKVSALTRGSNRHFPLTSGPSVCLLS